MDDQDLAPPAAGGGAAARGRLMRLILGYMAAQAVTLAAEMGIADLIGDDVRAGADLALDLGVSEPALRRLLRALAALGLLTETEPGRFALAEAGEPLRSGVPGSMRALARMFGHETMTAGWRELRGSVRTGRPAFDELFDADFFGYLADRPTLNDLFNEAMGEGSRAAGAEIAGSCDFSAANLVVDVGGGDGTLLAAVLAAHEHLHGIVFDTEHGLRSAPGVLAAAGVAGRCRLVSGDFFAAVPEGGDIYVLKSVLHDWDDTAALAILRACRAAMPDTATLLICEPVMPNVARADGAALPYLSDLNMLVNTGGRERTREEFQHLLAAADLGLTRTAEPATGGPYILRTRPAQP